MKCFLVINHINEIIYSNYDGEFVQHIRKFLKQIDWNQVNVTDDLNISNDILMHLFSPFLASQKSMHTQFGNTYSYIQCRNGLKLVFDKFMSHYFITIGDNNMEIKQILEFGLALAKHLCAFDIAQLKSENKSGQFTYLLNKWLYLSNKDETIKLEVIDRILLNIDLSNLAVNLLREICDIFRKQFQISKLHALFFVRLKFLGLFSSEKSQELSSANILFLLLFITENSNDALKLNENNVFDKQSSDNCIDSSSHQIFLFNTKKNFIPYQILKKDLSRNLHVFILIEQPVDFAGLNENHTQCVKNFNICLNNLSEIIETFEILAPPCQLSKERKSTKLIEQFESIKENFQNCQKSLKKIKEIMKKAHYCDDIPQCQVLQKIIDGQWDFLKKVFHEWNKSWQIPSQNIFNIWSTRRQNIPEESLINGNEFFHKLNSNISSFFEYVKQLFNLVVKLNYLKEGEENERKLRHFFEDKIVNIIEQRLNVNYGDYFQVKSLNNISFDSYLSEFPGMIHFMYIDRFHHQIFAPELITDSPSYFAKDHCLKMIDCCKKFLSRGFTVLSWKDESFTYSYFLWFENIITGAKLSPEINPENVKEFKLYPGIKNGDFYKSLVDCCFPKIGSSKVCCFELYCIHLCLIDSSVILEQARRLSVTIWDFLRLPKNVHEIY